HNIINARNILVYSERGVVCMWFSERKKALVPLSCTNLRPHRLTSNLQFFLRIRYGIIYERSINRVNRVSGRRI
ncbi:MAG: hypothetical protein M3239_04970, partial [Thermoproteota archaeon]|nr:hypothetical protein [Thermoproteota archaeon]